MRHITAGSGVDGETAAKPATTVQDCASAFVRDVFNQKLGRLEWRKPGRVPNTDWVFFMQKPQQSISRALSLDLKMRKLAKQINVKIHQIHGFAVLWTLCWFPLRFVCCRSEDAFNLSCGVQWRDCSTLFLCQLVLDKAAFSFKDSRHEDQRR